MTNPEISVIIPTRNRADVLKVCLSRLREEACRSARDIEVVIVDTSRNPLDLADYPSEAGFRVSYYYLGDVAFSMVWARNQGLLMATADIVAYIDDDCFVCPGWVDALLEQYTTDVVAVGGRTIYHPWAPIRRGAPVAGLDPRRDEIWAEWDRLVERPIRVRHLPGGNFSVRRAWALAVGGFDPGFTGSGNLEETDFFWRLGQYGRLLFTSEAIVEHRAAPRTDGIERRHTNFIYRYSAVRNRLYFLRKHRAGAGVLTDVRRQLRDLMGMTAKLLWEAIVFFTASALGILAGLVTPVKPGGALSSPCARQQTRPFPSVQARPQDRRGSASREAWEGEKRR